jgi:hypothetical protein
MVRSPLDTLKHLRKRVHDAEQSKLATHAETEQIADAERERARQVLLAATANYEATRREEDERLGALGITAAEGARRVAWEALQRKNRAALWDEHERAVDAYREAVEKHEQAREALGRADAELRQVEERIEQRERSRRRGEELAQQELLDEAALRRFLDRNGA